MYRLTTTFLFDCEENHASSDDSNKLRMRYATENDARNDTAATTIRTAAAVARTALLFVRRRDHAERDVLRVPGLWRDDRLLVSITSIADEILPTHRYFLRSRNDSSRTSDSR